MSLLVISPHADDAELGCGGYMYQNQRTGDRVLNVVLAVGNVYFEHLSRIVTIEERLEELSRAMAILQCESYVCFEEFDTRLDTLPLTNIISKIENQIKLFKPREVLIPLPSSHQDHEVAYRACIAACRPSMKTASIELIAAYEYPATSWGAGSGADAGKGGLYVEINEEALQTKLAALRCHESQIREDGHCWSLTAATAMAKMRGLEAGLEYAELFHVMRAVRRA
jgi:LmbE family N-acetylglucosaminyl deacetylase